MEENKIKKASLVDIMGLNRGMYEDIEINGKPMAIKKLTIGDILEIEDAMEFLELGDEDSVLKLDKVSGASVIARHLTPTKTLAQLCGIRDSFSIESNGDVFNFKNLDIVKAYNIKSNRFKGDVVNNSSVLKSNTSETLKGIFEVAEEDFNIGNLKSRAQAQDIMDKFCKEVNIEPVAQLFRYYEQFQDEQDNTTIEAGTGEHKG